MKKDKKISIIKYVLLLLFILVGIGVTTPMLAKNLKFGLDLKAGFEVLYHVDSINGEKMNSSMVESTYKTIVKRIDVLGVSEPVVTIEGEDKIRVQLAGVTDPKEARETLSQVASLSFRDADDNLLMTSDVLASNGAKIGADQSGRPAVALTVKNKDKFYQITKEVSQKNDNRIVIWLDFEEGKDSFKAAEMTCGSDTSKCLSAATVSEGFASDVIIQGNFTQEKVKNLVELINSGSLSTKLTEISSKTVDASFGKNSLNMTFTAGIIGLILVMVVMVILYRFAGLISSIGLAIYTFLTFLLFWLVGGVLTLPGIAAMLLGIGMAVDSNIINFARIKDELKTGKSVQNAYRIGSKNSFLTIIDANLTTFIVALILFIFGESSIKGFATMLMISIFITFVVMIGFTRWILKKFVLSGKFDEKEKLFIGYKESKKHSLFEKCHFSNNKGKLMSLGIILIIIGILSLVLQGLNLGIDFKGGSSITIQAEKELKIEEIKKDIQSLGYTLNAIEDISSKTKDVIITDSLDKKQVLMTEDYFKEKYNASTDIGVVSNIVKRELVKNAIFAVVLAAIGIVVYISIRFSFNYAIAGILALLHDTIIVIGIFSLFQLEVSTIFIAALLSIIGYSINDTIVLFDRVRENIKEKKLKNKEQLSNVVDRSIVQTINRNIFTSITTILPVICLILFGSHEILNFNIAMLIGLLIGSYSSLFMAVFIFQKLEEKNIGRQPKKKWYEEKEVEELKVKGINS